MDRTEGGVIIITGWPSSSLDGLSFPFGTALPLRGPNVRCTMLADRCQQAEEEAPVSQSTGIRLHTHHPSSVHQCTKQTPRTLTPSSQSLEAGDTEGHTHSTGLRKIPLHRAILGNRKEKGE